MQVKRVGLQTTLFIIVCFYGFTTFKNLRKLLLIVE